jgi:NAD(P)-dependent dehydrogenase (short-subunit alcohol dehydrogenase family)
MSKLAGKSVLITGASQGLGREMALRFAREGAAANASDIQATGLAPIDPNESAILVTLDSNNGYTAILRGNGPTPTGVALVEAYRLEN